MSTYIESSEISRFNRALPDTPTSVSASTVAVFQASLHLQRFSEGHFDPTVMPLVRLWGFGPDERSGAPDPEAIEAALAKVGIGAIELDVENGTLTKKSPVELDFSAIAKGYGVDAVAELLLQQGIKGFLVEIGGEVRVGGTKPDGSPWRVGIERPEMAGRSAQMVVDLKGLSIATSGDYRNYFEQDGVRYSHTLDPRTGYPVMSRLASVSVLAETCMQADGLATALMAMGERKAVEFAGSHGIDAYFMVREGEGFKELFTGRFRQHALH
jgi:thiamine biosynthesis lipoprotein